MIMVSEFRGIYSELSAKSRDPMDYAKNLAWFAKLSFLEVENHWYL